VDDRSAIAWLARRAGFGLLPGDLDAGVALGVGSVVDRLVEPDAHGVAVAPDPWDGLDLAPYPLNDPRSAAQRQPSIQRWLAAMVTTPRPLEEWMRWFWHGHFVSTLRTVKEAPLMVGQLRMLGRLGLGDFPTLLRAVAVDPAMLVYLDGQTSRRGAVNENFGREVLELFALGIGNYTEDDVRAGATACTGWTVDRSAQAAVFRPARHDDSPQTYLGRSGVHDVGSVVDAIVAHPACAPFVAGRLGRAILGPDVDQGVLDDLARGFAASGLQLRPLVRSILEAGLAGASTPLVLAPVPWTVTAVRSVGLEMGGLGRNPLLALNAAGQVPMDAPNVGGWPRGTAWLSSSTTLARISIAGTVAHATPAGAPARQAAAAGDLGALAAALGRPDGFSPATTASLQSLGSGPSAAVGVLTVALASPDLEIA
jgi:uncharacterized protein (DUF1800 family)